MRRSGHEDDDAQEREVKQNSNTVAMLKATQMNGGEVPLWMAVTLRSG